MKPLQLTKAYSGDSPYNMEDLVRGASELKDGCLNFKCYGVPISVSVCTKAGEEFNNGLMTLVMESIIRKMYMSYYMHDHIFNKSLRGWQLYKEIEPQIRTYLKKNKGFNIKIYGKGVVDIVVQKKFIDNTNYIIIRSLCDSIEIGKFTINFDMYLERCKRSSLVYTLGKNIVVSLVSTRGKIFEL